MIHIKPPEKFKHILIENKDLHSIFLAGSIEQGKATHWQSEVVNKFEDSDVIILNPRRDSWDASWKQDISNVVFSEQVNWEMDGLNLADHVLMYLEPSTMAPISLLEAGLIANQGKLCICCPKGYWRLGNVQILANRYDIPLYEDLDVMIREFREDFNL